MIMTKKQIFNINSQIKNFIQTYNNQLKNIYKTIKEDDTENTYLVLLYEDLAKNLKDKNQFIDDYIAFAEEWKLPFTFYPYYGSFNKALIKVSSGIPHPSFEAVITKKDNKVIDISHQISFGCLVLNVNILKKINFKFDQNYPTVFYLQDLAEKCYRNKLWCSNCWFLDIHNSWEYVVKDSMDMMNPINMKTFQAEQKKYFEEHKDSNFKEASAFLDDFKKWMNGEEVAVEITSPTTNVSVQNTNINLSVPSELVANKDTIKIETESFDKKEEVKEQKKEQVKQQVKEQKVENKPVISTVIDDEDEE